MINDEQLSMYEDIALDCAFIDLQEIILELIAEVRRLQAYEPVGQEFDWVNGDD